MRLSKQYKGKRYTIYAIVCDDGSCPAIEYLEKVEKDNPSLKDVLPKVFARGNLDPTNLGGLIDLVGNIALGDAKARFWLDKQR